MVEGATSLIGSLGRQASQTVLLRIAGQAVTIVSGIIITRHLGPTGKGIYAYAFTFLVFFSTLSGGLASAVSWQWRRRDKPIGEVYGAAVVIGGVFSLLTCAGLAIVAFAVPSQRVLLAVVAALIPTIYMSASNGFFLAVHRVDVTNVQYTIIRLMPFLSAMLVLFVHEHVLELVLTVWILGQFSAGLYSFRELMRLVSFGAIVFRREAVVENVRFAVRVGLVKFMETLNARIDVFLVMLLRGPSDLGIYSVAIGIVELLWIVSRNVALSAYGRIATSPEAESIDVVRVCTRHVLALTALLAACAFVAAPMLVVRLYGEPFAAATPAIQVLLVGAVAWSCFPVAEVYFTVREGRPNVILLVQTIGTVLCGVITGILVHRIGILGGAIGTTIAYLVGTATLLVLFARSANVAVPSLFAYTAADLYGYRTAAVSGWRKIERACARG